MNYGCFGLFYEAFRRTNEEEYRCLVTCLPPVIHAHFANCLEYDAESPLRVQTQTLGTVYYKVVFHLSLTPLKH